jgi:hypothetical protein
MYLQKVTAEKIVLKNKFFAGILKVNDENSRIRIQDLDLGSAQCIRAILTKGEGSEIHSCPYPQNWLQGYALYH